MRGMGNFNELFKKAQKLQEEFLKLQDELRQKTVEATAGGGVVKVTANGAKEIVDIKIDKEIIASNDIEMLQDLIVAATNEALNKAQELANEESKKITGNLGINLPNIF